MTKRTVSNTNTAPAMGSCYFFSFTKARFFAGLFAVPKNQFCPVNN